MPSLVPPSSKGRRPSFAPSASKLVLAIAAAWPLMVPVAWSQPAATPAAAAETVRNYAIAPGSLTQVISRFAAEAGIALTFDHGALQGQTSPGVQGEHTVQSGLNQALASSEWVAHRAGDGIYVLNRRGPADSVATLSAVRVSSSGGNETTTEGTDSYNATAITVFQGTQSIRDTPQPVTVVTQQMLEDRGMLDLTDVLNNVPGVTVDYTDSERVGYYSRGFQIDSLQIDGLSISQGGTVFVQPDTAVLDRVEILRGAAGVLRGAGNPSATVNLVRKRPTEEFQSSVGLTLGSWNRRRAELDISGPLNEAGTLRGRLIAVADKKDFFQDAREEDRRVFYGVLQADLGSNTTLTASLQHTELDATGAWGGMPANFDGTQLDMPRSTYLGADWNRWNRYNQQAFLELEHRFDNGWNVKLSGAHTRLRMDDGGFKQTSVSRSSTTNPYLANVSTSIYDGDASDQNTLNLIASGPFQMLGRRHELVVGGEIARTKNTGTSGYFNVSPVSGVDIRDWDPGSSMPEPFYSPGNGTAYTGPDSRTKQEGIFATARLSLADPLTAIIGGRLSWWSYENPDSPASNYNVDQELTPYLGLVYDISPTFSAYASYSEIFLPQNAYDSGGQLLQPIRGEDYEAGIKGEFFGGRLTSSLSLFRINNTGKAVDDASSANPCLPNYLSGYCKMAGGKTRSEGWELEVAGELMPGWHVMAGYTNTRTKYLADSNANNVGQPIRSIDPRHLFRLFTTYKLKGDLQGLTLGAGVQVQSESYVRSGNVVARQGGYAIYNAMASYEFNRHLRMQLNVNNVFDKVYYRKYSASGFNSYYGDPRNVMLSMTYKF